MHRPTLSHCTNFLGPAGEPQGRGTSVDPSGHLLGPGMEEPSASPGKAQPFPTQGLSVRRLAA